MLISDSYLELNKKLHEAGSYGKSGHRWSAAIEQIIENYKIESLLDYGAGQQTLERTLRMNSAMQGLNIRSYDPVLEELSGEPSPAELLTCTDVLEHIEPELLNAVVDHISHLTLKFAFFVIPTGPAGKFLADGRNAHLIQKPLEWWIRILVDKFNIISINNMTGDIILFLAKKTTCGSVNSEVNKHVENILKSNNITSLYFDGLSLNVFLKSKRPLARVLPRLLSIVRLGRRTGIAEACHAGSNAVRVNLVKY
jgi:hypothetical protein